MKKIIALLFILSTAYTLLKCMEKEEELIEESVQAPAINAEYRKLKDKLVDMATNNEDYINRLMLDYSLSERDAKDLYDATYRELFNTLLEKSKSQK